MAKLKQQDEAKENEQTQQEPVEIEESQPTVVTRVTDDSETESSENAGNDFEIPDELPILPLRGLVVYPETAVPLMVGQPRSIRLIALIERPQR